MRRLLLVTASTAAIVMASPNAAMAFSLFTADNIDKEQFTGDSFTAELAREYQKLSLYERDEMVDWPDAEIFADKAMMAGDGKIVAPVNPADWYIDNAQTLDELKQARGMLTNALIKMTADQANTAAIAQVSYDCWVEQAEEAWQTSHIAACRQKFMAAIDELSAEPPAPPLETMTLLNQPVVFFDFDSSVITPEASRVIEAAANRIRIADEPRLEIIGHADTTGSMAYNETLSVDRAQAVKDALMGYDLGQAAQSLDVTLKGLGETDLMVETADGIREPTNRRVEIQIWGMAPALVSSLPQ